MATFKHISSKNADYGAAEQYLTFEHDEFTMKPTLDKNGQIIPRTGYLISSLNRCSLPRHCRPDSAGILPGYTHHPAVPAASG